MEEEAVTRNRFVLSFAHVSIKPVSGAEDVSATATRPGDDPPPTELCVKRSEKSQVQMKRSVRLKRFSSDPCEEELEVRPVEREAPVTARVRSVRRSWRSVRWRERHQSHLESGV